MTPTPELRFVERTIKRDLMDGDRVVIKDSVVVAHVLQQKWARMGGLASEHEWRDVPLVKEETR